MLVASYHVRIEQHQVGAIPVLLFHREEEAAAQDAPLVVVVHGLSSRKERHLDLCLRLADSGYRAVALDARSHGERRDEETTLLFADHASPEFFAAFARTVAGTVEDIALLARYFGVKDAEGGTGYGIVGHSMGGFIALHTALADPRARALVVISGVIDLSLLPPDRAVVAPDAAPLRFYADVHARASELAGRALLLLHGDADAVVPVSGARRLFALLDAVDGEAGRRALVEYPGVGHEMIPAMAEAAVDGMRRHLPAKGTPE